MYDALLELEIHERDRSKLAYPDDPFDEATLEWKTEHDRLTQKLWLETKINEPIDPT